MRRVILTSVAAMVALLAFSVLAWSGQDQQQNPPSQTQPSASQAQTQGKGQTATQHDSLADAARKAREQRKEAAKPAKVFTNENIPTEGGISSVGAEPTAAAVTGGAGAKGSGQAADKGEKQGASGGAEKMWRERFAKLHHKLEQDESELDVMQREIGVLNTQFYNDPVKTMQQGITREDINKKSADIDAKKKQVEDDKKAIADAEDELRKSGGDPGWASQ